jgi:hypothetical protein
MSYNCIFSFFQKKVIDEKCCKMATSGIIDASIEEGIDKKSFECVNSEGVNSEGFEINEKNK